MAKVKRVLVEGIDVGGPVSGALIKQANRLVESSGLDVSSTAREKILSDLLSPGKYARLLAYMNHSDITGTYAQPGGVKKFVEEALATQADVTDALAFLSGGLKDPAAWLQRPALGGNRMPLGQLNGPEDSVVVLNVPKAVLNFTNPKNKEEAAAILEKLLSHNHFVAHLSVPQAKKGLPDPNAKTVEELLDHFNFAAITGYKVPADRQAAVAEWKEAKQQAVATVKKQVSSNAKIDQLAHALYDALLEILGKHGLPADEPAANGVYTLGKQALDDVFDALPDEDKKNAKLRFDVRRSAISKFPRNKDLWLLVLEGHIKDYLERYNEKFADKTKTAADTENVAPPETSDAVKDFGKNLKYGWWIKKSEDQPGKYQLGFAIKKDQSQTATSSPIKKISLDKSGDNGNGIVSIETENSVYTAPVNLMGGVNSHEALSHLPNYDSKMKKLDLVDLFIKNFNGTSDDNELPAGEGEGEGEASTKLPPHIQGALSDYAKNLKKIAGKNNVSTKELLAAINNELEAK